MLQMQQEPFYAECRANLFSLDRGPFSAPKSVANGQRHTLSRVKLFSGVARESVGMFDTRCLWKSVKFGEWMVDPSAEGDSVYFVVQGHAQVVVACGGRDIILRDLRDGDFASGLFAVGGMVKWTGIRAMTNVVAARMSAVSFREAIERHPIVRDRVLEHLAGEIDHLIGKMIMLTNLSVRGRLSSQLLSLARPGSDGRLVVSPPPNHAELAARIGTRRESVTKHLSAMRSEGCLVRSRGALTIVAPEKLRRMISADERSLADS